MTARAQAPPRACALCAVGVKGKGEERGERKERKEAREGERGAGSGPLHAKGNCRCPQLPRRGLGLG